LTLDFSNYTVKKIVGPLRIGLALLAIVGSMLPEIIGPEAL
jgi:hypothetical protein